MRTGENEQGLKKIIDMTRMIAIIVVLLHFYDNCYGAFKAWGWTAPLSDKILDNITRTGLLTGFLKSKLIALGFLLISLMGIKGRKDEKMKYRTALGYFVIGLIFYFAGYFFLVWYALDLEVIAVCYMFTTGLGFILILAGGSLITRIIKKN